MNQRTCKASSRSFSDSWRTSSISLFCVRKDPPLARVFLICLRSAAVMRRLPRSSFSFFALFAFVGSTIFLQVLSLMGERGGEASARASAGDDRLVSRARGFPVAAPPPPPPPPPSSELHSESLPGRPVFPSVEFSDLVFSDFFPCSGSGGCCCIRLFLLFPLSADGSGLLSSSKGDSPKAKVKPKGIFVPVWKYFEIFVFSRGVRESVKMTELK